MKLTTQSYIVLIDESRIFGGYFDSWGDDDTLFLRLPQDIGIVAWERFLHQNRGSLDLRSKLSILNPATIGLKSMVIKDASKKLTGVIIL